MEATHLNTKIFYSFYILTGKCSNILGPILPKQSQPTARKDTCSLCNKDISGPFNNICQKPNPFSNDTFFELSEKKKFLYYISDSIVNY